MRCAECSKKGKVVFMLTDVENGRYMCLDCGKIIEWVQPEGIEVKK
jgi:transcription initiation factor TFIIIB Brf1 subunit/transcription initiation factor TFIIB